MSVIKRRYSDAEEKTIRHQFYVMKMPVWQILEQWKDRRLSEGGLRRIVCGPLTKRGKDMEAAAETKRCAL